MHKGEHLLRKIMLHLLNLTCKDKLARLDQEVVILVEGNQS